MKALSTSTSTSTQLLCLYESTANQIVLSLQDQNRSIEELSSFSMRDIDNDNDIKREVLEVLEEFEKIDQQVVKFINQLKRAREHFSDPQLLQRFDRIISTLHQHRPKVVLRQKTMTRLHYLQQTLSPDQFEALSTQLLEMMNTPEINVNEDDDEKQC